MNSLVSTLIAFYSRLLQLFPPGYREEFAEEMLLDFSSLTMDASKKGVYSLALFCLQELIDFRINLLSVHVREGRIFKILRSQPMNFGLRGAIVFGVVFTLTAPLSLFYYEIFHVEQGSELLSLILQHSVRS